MSKQKQDKMSLLQSVEERLTCLVPSEFKQVGSSLTLSMIMNNPPPAGVSAWVVPIGETPTGDTRTAGAALQKVNLIFGVLLGVRSFNDQRGNKSNAQLDQARDAVRNKLFGWTPATALLPCLLSNSELVNMDQGVIFWLDRYTTAIQRRASQA